MANIYNNIGALYLESEQITKAKKYLTKAVEIRETIVNTDIDRSDLADAYGNIGILYGNLGQNIKAKKYFSKAIAIMETLAQKAPDIIPIWQVLIIIWENIINIVKKMKRPRNIF